MSVSSRDVIAQALHHNDVPNHFVGRIVEQVLLQLSDGGELCDACDRYRLSGQQRSRVEQGVRMALAQAKQEIKDWEDAGMNMSILGMPTNPLEIDLARFVMWQQTPD